MKNKALLIVLCFTLFIVSACCVKREQNSNIEKFYLEDKYYNKGIFINVDSDTLSKIKDENYVLFTYNNYCSLNSSCKDIFADFMKKHSIDFLSIPFDEFKKTELHDTVKYAPSVVVVEKGKIITYLDAESDADLKIYESTLEFEKWLNKYIYLSK